MRWHVVLCVAAIIVTAWAEEPSEQDRSFKECPECPVMIGIPSGSFLMGSPPTEQGRFDNEGPRHKVTLKAFALAKYPVTGEDYLAFLQDSRYRPEPCDARLGIGWHVYGDGRAYPPFITEPRRWPAMCLSWKDAKAYIGWLNAKLKLARPGVRGNPYRLPSEAEWEYAARAGTDGARWWGDAIGTGNANCNGCGSAWDNRELASVESFPANRFGMVGMLGNVWEWTEDCWHRTYQDAPADGSAWSEKSCTRHVLRGGAWNNLPVFVRSAARSGGTDGGEYDYSSLAGFRLARTLP